MPGWSRQKRETVEAAFYAYLEKCHVDSKDGGRICLGDNLYWGQRYVITEIFNALEKDIHRVYILKSRQLGISTLVRALTVFMLGIHTGMKGALVFDTAPNRDEARQELVSMIRNLPPSLRFPKVKGTGEGNREGLTLENDSRILFKSAGVKQSKSSGTLGRSVGLSFLTISELCSIENDAGLEALDQSLSDLNPDRLYIYESTARGFNKWFEIWSEAKEDPAHCKTLFLGFWSKESQRIDPSDPDWAQYGEAPLTDRELAKVEAVREQYGYEISMSQMAWLRRKMNPAAQTLGTEEDENTTRLQEQPATEEEAFQQTGSIFFPPQKLTDATVTHASSKFERYYYLDTAVEFVEMRAYKGIPSCTHLKVWEEPDIDGSYAIGVDPAYGENENNDRSSIQVLRCYADGVDQVAEYAWPLVNTRQLAWVVASLLGWYGAGRAEARYILELNGPGNAVFQELKALKHQIDNAYQAQQYADQGLKDIFRNVKTFIYNRPDSMFTNSTTLHWKTSAGNKITILERMRDFVSNGMLHIRSMSLIDEMKTIAREGDSIKAPGNMKDDRVLAMALAVHCWEDRARKTLIQQKRTRQAEEARKTLSIVDQVSLFQQNQLTAFFDQKRRERVQQRIDTMRMSWRYK